MIKQGSNKPIILRFKVEPSDVSVTLHNEIETIKHWKKSDMSTGDGVTFKAWFTQIESAAFPEGPCEIEVRWIDSSGSKQGIVQKKIIRENIERTVDDTLLEPPEMDEEIIEFVEEEILDIYT